MALILLVNLAFSVVGFFVIFRMWRLVKSRRDYYGEHFEIPRGEDRTKKSRKHARKQGEVMEQNPVPLSMDDVESLVKARLEEERRAEAERVRIEEEEARKRAEMEERKRREEQEREERERLFREQGDLQRMIAQAVAAQMEER